ncbi:uncharacterized protein Dwil_GK28244 [Drosophila willistoni]|uniref:Uncharacterized protein n=1 Tax=Drosophila willistoni TaxID=7260 RepID=A0A0Q9WYV3_DROWI|nr:uncharacterized protein LOC26530246 [Drosophila willistoni]KRF98328.1 uncharacterized protein Dwil_GK28244 [Drosophila willistoni]
MDVIKKPKKSKKSKAPKDSSQTLKLAALQKKQKEVARVLNLKNEIIMKGLSYLEYMDLRAEIERLNGLKEHFTRRVEKLKQQAK